MSNYQNDISKRRDQLWKKEKALLTEIEHESSLLEKRIESLVKASLVIGSGILIGYSLYKGISQEEKAPKKKSSDRTKKGTKQVTSSIQNQILGEIVKRGLSLLINSINTRGKKI